MKYQVRYYLNGDKTRFYETEFEYDPARSSFTFTLSEVISRLGKATIQKIVKL